jgi:hypothetical protein
MHNRTMVDAKCKCKGVSKKGQQCLQRLSMLSLNKDKQVTLWEVESWQQKILSKDLIKHANKVLRLGLWVSYIFCLR